MLRLNISFHLENWHLESWTLYSLHTASEFTTSSRCNLRMAQPLLKPHVKQVGNFSKRYLKSISRLQSKQGKVRSRLMFKTTPWSWNVHKGCHITENANCHTVLCSKMWMHSWVVINEKTNYWLQCQIISKLFH
jgi:hypothetical protein